MKNGRDAPRRAGNGRRGGGGYQPDETRSGLLASALELFEQRGYPGTSVEDIVAGAGMTKGAFYHHFGSKEEVLHIIHDTYIDHIKEVTDRIISEVSDPVEQVRELIRASVLNLGEYRSHITVYMQDRRFLTGERNRAIAAKRGAVDRLIEGAIERGVEQGVFRDDVAPRLIGFGIIGMCAWVIQWWRPDGRFSLEEVADQYTAMVLDGMFAGTSARRRR